jgi:virginiamycin A acetyltransferase
VNKLKTKDLLNSKALFFLKELYVLYNNYLYKSKNTKIKILWRHFNQHNNTSVANSTSEMIFPLEKVSVGRFSYGPLCVHSFGNTDERLRIGSFCSISNGVKFILGGNHQINSFSTFAFNYYFKNKIGESWTKGPITVEDDVWIGTDAIILSGVTLCKGTIVAAGSVVTKSSLPYSVIGGNPAKQIKMRFDEVLIKELLDFDFSKIKEENISFLLPKLNMPLNEKLLADIKKELLGIKNGEM